MERDARLERWELDVQLQLRVAHDLAAFYPLDGISRASRRELADVLVRHSCRCARGYCESAQISPRSGVLHHGGLHRVCAHGVAESNHARNDSIVHLSC